MLARPRWSGARGRSPMSSSIAATWVSITTPAFADPIPGSAGDVEREVSELARPRQSDHDQGAPRPHEAGHTSEPCLRVHVVEGGH